MKTGIFKAPFSAAILMFALTAGSQAVADIHCATLEGLNETMAYLAFTSDATTSKDRLALEGKLDEAQAKLDESKVCNAGLKVSDFNSKLFRMATAAKPKASETAPGALRCALEGSAALAEAWLVGCEDAGDPPRGKGPKNK